LITYWYNAKNPSTKKSLTGLNNFYDGTFKVDFKLPSAGKRDYVDASLIGQGSEGWYWSSSPVFSNLYYASYLYFGYVNEVSADHSSSYAYRTNGYSVRCFKNSPDASETLILTFHENGGDLL
jgi:uncharacterized protein (TIGR02145 family)